MQARRCKRGVGDAFNDAISFPERLRAGRLAAPLLDAEGLGIDRVVIDAIALAERRA